MRVWHRFYTKSKVERRSMLVPGNVVDLSSELFDDHFWNHETQPDSFWVCVFDWSEQSEDLALVFVFDTDASVVHRDAQLLLLGYHLNQDGDLAVPVCKLYCVGVQVQQHLLQSLSVCLYELVVKPFVGYSHIYALHQDFEFLDFNQLVNSLCNVELLDVLSEILVLLVQHCVV